MEQDNFQALHRIIFDQPKVRLSAYSRLPQNGLLQIAILILTFICGFTACKNDSNTTNRPKLIITSPIALLAEADEKSAVVEQLENGTEVADLNKTSRFVASIHLNDRHMQEPWLRVETKSGKQGWVFAGAVRPKGMNAQQQYDWVLEKRFQAWFGLQLTQRWQDWVAQKPIPTDAIFAQILRADMQLCDTLNQLMTSMVSRDQGQSPPDLFWLGESAPYFIIQQGPNGGVYQLLLNYKAVAAQAAQTAGAADDQFARIGCAAFPLDSIASPLPAWVFPLSLEKSCSNLGSGKHLHILKMIDQALKNSKLFQPELLAFKDWILTDILDKSRTYWQAQAKILAELKQIDDAKLACLNARDRLALRARKAMFEAPEENGLQLNLRTGE